MCVEGKEEEGRRRGSGYFLTPCEEKCEEEEGRVIDEAANN